MGDNVCSCMQFICFEDKYCASKKGGIGGGGQVLGGTFIGQRI